MLYQNGDMYFAIMMVIGIVSALFYIFKKLKKILGEFDAKSYNRLVIILCYSGIAFYFFSYFFDNLFHVFGGEKWGEGGITFIGGLIGCLATFLILYIIFLKEKKALLMTILEILIVGIVLGQAFGRIGCFLAGCCYGKITDSFLGVVFPVGSKPFFSVYNHYLNSGLGKEEALELAKITKIIPTQLIESFFLFLLFGLLNLIKKYQLPVYLSSYGIFRFVIEYFRGDNRGFISGTFSPSQVFSILMMVSSIVLFIYMLRKNKRKETN